MALVGYAHVSTDQQINDLQMDALKAAGCDRILISGGTTEREGLSAVLKLLRDGDTLCLHNLDEIGRSLSHVVATVMALDARDIGFRSLTENIDTSAPHGRLVMNTFAALANFERATIRERVNAGLAAAKARGRVGGRPRIVDSAKTKAIQSLRANGTPVPEVCKTLGISRATYFRYLQRSNEAEVLSV